jgi:hypothetical protein
MDNKTVCLKVWLVPVCLISLIVLSLYFICWLVPPVQASLLVLTTPDKTGDNTILPGIILNPTSGPKGSTVVITGTNFESNSSGKVWFDKHQNWLFEDDEPSASVLINDDGTFAEEISLTVPDVSPGTYYVLADIPVEKVIEAKAEFTVTKPMLTINPTATISPPFTWFHPSATYIKEMFIYPDTGIPTTIVTITGRGFQPNVLGLVWFDIHPDSIFNDDEPSYQFSTTAEGTFPEGICLTVPDVPPGKYYILADAPIEASMDLTHAPIEEVIEAKAEFTVEPVVTDGTTPPPVTPVKGQMFITPDNGVSGTTIFISGNNFPSNADARVWFDSNNNMVYDSDEPLKEFITNEYGGFYSVTLKVPPVSDAIYLIGISTPDGSILGDFKLFEVIQPQPPPMTENNPLLWVEIFVPVVIVGAVSTLTVKNRLDKKNTEKTEAKFKNGEVTIKVSNVKGKVEIKPDTPLKADKAIGVRLVQDSGKQTIKVKGRLILDVKEKK